MLFSLFIYQFAHFIKFTYFNVEKECFFLVLNFAYDEIVVHYLIVKFFMQSITG